MKFEFPPSGSGSGSGSVASGTFVASNAEAKALTGLAVGDIVYVANQDTPFVVVDDDSLGSDGGTVIIPDSELSDVYEEVIPEGTFAGASAANIAMEYDLDHAGIDLDSVECVLTDAGETITGWDLHGHVCNMGYPERVDTPQCPLIVCDRGKFRDPRARLTTQANTRTDGMLLRYRYATSGLRLKRMAGPRWDLRWWPVVSTDEETGTQIDNGNYIRWALNSAAAAGAAELYFHDFYHYSDCIEQPDGVAFVGRSMQHSGLRVMDGKGYYELLLSNGTSGDNTLFPLATPITRHLYFKGEWVSYTPTIFAATGAMTTTWRDFKLDGNIENNNIWDNKEDYAYLYVNTGGYFHNAPHYNGLSFSDHSNRTVPEGHRYYLHNVEISNVGGNCMLGNHNSYCHSTGVLRVGNAMHNHIIYLVDGQFEQLDMFGYTWGDGYRCRDTVIQYLRDRPTRHPEINYTEGGASYYEPTQPQVRLSYSQPVPQREISTDPGPEKPRHKLIIDYYDGDYSGMDPVDPAAALTTIFMLGSSADNVQIKAGHVRLQKITGSTPILIAQAGNGTEYAAYANVSVKMGIEIQSRHGFSLFSTFTNWGYYKNADFDLMIEPLASSHIPEAPSPDGVSILLGNANAEQLDTYDGEEIDFSAAAAADLSGDYIDITPAETTPVFRVWFDYNSASSAPSGTGVTLIEVNVAVGATTEAIAAAFTAAIRANVDAYALLTAANFGTKAVIGSYNFYRAYPVVSVTVDVTNATGVTTAGRTYRRYYEPGKINYKIIANDPIYLYLINHPAIGADRDLTLHFKDSVLGAYEYSVPLVNASGSLANAGVDAAKDKLHYIFEDTTFDLRDGMVSQNLDLLLYAGHFRNCRIRTPAVLTGVTTMGTGYEELYSEQSSIETFTPSGAATTYDIQTKLFNIPKDGQTRIYPANAAATALWNTVYPTWRKSARPVGGASTALGGTGLFYQGPNGTSEDRRAPMLRLNFSSAPAAVELKVGWAAAVSP